MTDKLGGPITYTDTTPIHKIHIIAKWHNKAHSLIAMTVFPIIFRNESD